MRRLRAGVAVALLSLIATPIHAEVTQMDLQIAARALSFMEKPLTGNVRLGVVYRPGDAQSIRRADAVAKLLGDGLTVGNVTFRPVTVNIDQAITAPVDAFFLPDGLGAGAAKISEATAKRKVPCITLDLPQVEAGYCVLGVKVDPKVQIYLNRAAAAQSDTRFASVFLMMITEF